MNFTDFPDFTLQSSPELADPIIEDLRNFDESWIQQTALNTTIEEWNIYDNNKRYTLLVDSIPFETLYFRSPKKKLYVMFSGGGAGTRRYPLFLRWKYKNFLDGNILLIDDPMYHYHKDITHVMWYYGTPTVSYLHLALKIIKKLITELCIKTDDVCFIGSSGGGTAALYMGNLLDNSTVISMNPQICLDKWQYPGIYNNFLKWGIDLSAEDTYFRNKITLTNPSTTFFICVNYKSDVDYNVQFRDFCQRHNIEAKYGISQSGNILTWVHATDYFNIHAAIPEKVGIVIMDYLIKKACQGCDINDFNNISILLNEALHEKYVLRQNIYDLEKAKKIYMNSFFDLFSQALTEKWHEIIGDSTQLIAKIISEKIVNWYITKKLYFQLLLHKDHYYFRLICTSIKLDNQRITSLKLFCTQHPDMRYHYANDRMVITKVLCSDSYLNQLREFIIDLNSLGLFS